MAARWLAAEKGQYIYYHCTGHKGRCPEPYIREEILVEQFALSLGRIRLDAELAIWMESALRDRNTEQKQLAEASLSQLQSEYSLLQTRLDAMYVDKLDGKIFGGTIRAKLAPMAGASERDSDHHRCQRHDGTKYLTDGVHVLELASKAYELSLSGSPAQRRRIIRLRILELLLERRQAHRRVPQAL